MESITQDWCSERRRLLRYGCEEMKHQLIHALQKYVLNPPIKLLFALGIVPPGYALLETIGRKTGKARSTPVGDALVGRQFWIVAEHGMKAGYVRNIKQNPRVRLKLREGLRARWHTARRTCSGTMIHVRANAGLLVRCLAAERMRLGASVRDRLAHCAD
jgi:deazaflavin-dependent oxidoreductase (nitroreductase family)